MRKSAAPSVLAKKLQELGKENAGEVKSSVWEKAGGNKPRQNFLSSRKKFKTPVASLGLVDPSAPKLRSEVATGGIRSEGFALHNDLKVEKDALLLGRNPSHVLNLINLGREGAVGNKSTSVSDNSGNLLSQSANSLPPSIPDFVPDLVGESECDGENLDLPSVVNLKSIPGRSLLSGSSSTLGVKRNCPHDGGFEDKSHILRKSHHPNKKQGESLLNGEVVRVEKLPEILKVKIVSGDRLSAESKHLYMIQLPLGGTDRADLNVRSESTSSEGKEEQSFYVKEEHNNKEVPLDPKITKVRNTLHGHRSQGPSLHHEVSLKETLRSTQEAVLAKYYSVMYCPRKKNAKRKGPWFDGIIICQGRSCTLQDMDRKVITKANVQGLKDMPEGATLEVGKFEVEVMRKASSEEVLSGALYLVDEASQPIPALAMKKQTFKSFKLGGSQQSRSAAGTKELHVLQITMKAMEDRRFDWNLVRLQIPRVEKQLPRTTSPLDIPVRHTRRDSLSSPDSVEECILKALDEEEQPLLRLEQPNGSALQNSKVTGECTRNERVPRLVLPQKKRTCSLSGLVASNDFFIPCPLTPTTVYPPPSCTGRDTTIQKAPRAPMTPRTPRTDFMTPRTPRIDLMTPRTPRKEVLADSLRGQYTPRNSTKGGSDLSRKGNWAGGFLGRAIRGRERYIGNWLQTPRGSYQSAISTTNNGMATDLEKKLQEQGLTPVYCPEPRCDYRRLGNVASMITDLRVFLIRPVPEDYGPIECHIRRHVHAKWLTPSYRLYLSDGDRFLLSSKKRKKTKTNYTISLDENDTSKRSGNYFGKLRSNFVGSEYWFYDKGTPPIQSAGSGTMRLPTTKNRVEMGAVKYHVNVLGIAGPRKMTAIIPSLQEDGKPHVFPPAADGGPVLMDDYKCGQFRDKMVIMHNKQPHFNKQLAAYCLNFNGRVTKPSVKNFQLVADSDPDAVILQFGKIGRNLFTMDYQHPMSALQAFSICLSSLDPKIACE